MYIRPWVRLALVALLAACQSPQPDVDRAVAPTGGSVENGQLVFAAGGCASCHASPGQMLAEAPALGGGRALRSRFGVFHAPNISPHPLAGIGTWSRAEFARAMRQGLAPDGHAYYPAFPYPSYARMTSRDIDDLFAYLATLPQVASAPPGNDLVFPVNQPVAARIWRRLFLRPGPAVALDGASAQVARGQYLVEGPGHCGACHTPTGELGGPRKGRWLAGARMPDDSGFAPNLTPHEDGLAGYSADDIVTALRPFEEPSEADEGMAAVRARLTALPESDLYAIAAYLQALPPVASNGQ